MLASLVTEPELLGAAAPGDFLWDLLGNSKVPFKRVVFKGIKGPLGFLASILGFWGFL